MKPYLCLLPLLLLSCKNEPAQTTQINKPADTNQTVEQPATTAELRLSLWDFDGDGKPDDFISDSIIKGQGNPAEDSIPDRYTLIFDNHTLPGLPVGCCEPIPVGEGDLDGDGRAELTIVQSPMNGCMYTINTWSFKNGRWKQVFGPELFSTGCSGLGGRPLSSLIVKENGTLYFYRTALNDEDLKKVKTEIHLK